MFNAAHVSLVLLVISSNLQSCFVAHATSIACGSIATFGPTPLVAGGSSSTPLTATLLHPSSSPIYRVHGNADDTCIDAYTVALSSVGTTINSDIELTYFKGSETYKVCSSGYSTDCALPRLVPFFNPRQGAWKTSMLGVTPARAWTAPAAAPATTFTISIAAGTHSFTSLVSAGYAFPLSLSLQRQCSLSAYTIPWGSQIAVTSSSLAFNVSGLAAGVYSVCVKVLANGTVVSGPFPISGVLGHSVHNLKIGLPDTDVQWQISPVSLSRLSYATVLSSEVTFIAENAILTDGWKYFGIDTSADICSPLLTSSFDFSQLQPYNATHVIVTTTIPRPVGAPGGGQAVLCGSLGATAPWTLLSTTQYWPWVYDCPSGFGSMLVTTGQAGCSACGPSANNQCNGHGDCGTFEDKTHLRSSSSCSCYARYYTSDSYCDRYDLDPPVLTPGNGTYHTKHLAITVEAAHPNWATITWPGGSPQFQCASDVCTFTISSTTTLQVTSVAANLSATLNPLSYSYNIVVPTESVTTSTTRTESFSLTSTDSGSESDSASGTESSTNSLSRSQSITVSALRLPKGPQKKTPTIRVLPPEQSATYTPTMSMSHNVSDVVVPAWFSVTLTSQTNYSSAILSESGFPPCRTADCSAGISLLCSNMTLYAAFVSPQNHSCNVTFEHSNGTVLRLEVFVEPLPLTPANIFSTQSPTFVTSFRYRAANIPYLTSSQLVLLRNCESDSWTTTALQLPRGNRCIVGRTTAAGFTSVESRLQIDTPTATSQSANVINQIPDEQTTFAAATDQPSNLTPGGVILGVTTGVVLSLAFLTQIVS